LIIYSVPQTDRKRNGLMYSVWHNRPMVTLTLSLTLLKWA